MKGQLSEVLIPIDTKMQYKSENNYPILKAFLVSSILLLLGLTFIRYENKVSELEVRLTILEIEAIRREFKIEELQQKDAPSTETPRTKREANTRWTQEYSHLDSTRSSRRHQEPLVRNHEDETFFTKGRDGSYVRPSGLREIHDRLPPQTHEVHYQSPPINYQHQPTQQLETRSGAGAGGRMRYPPVQQVGSGSDQVSARVVRFDDDETTSTVAAHYVADVSNFTSNDNPRLRNSNGIFQIWRPAQWMSGSNFVLDKTDGVVTVQKEGLYHIYAQIHYHDEQGNSFTVEVNDVPLLQCTTSQLSNSCFTGGLTMLKRNDRIVIKNVGVDRFSIYKPEKSFFGLVRVGN